MARVVARRPGQAVRQPLEDGAGPRVEMILKYCYIILIVAGSWDGGGKDGGDDDGWPRGRGGRRTGRHTEPINLPVPARRGHAAVHAAAPSDRGRAGDFVCRLGPPRLRPARRRRHKLCQQRGAGAGALVWARQLQLCQRQSCQGGGHRTENAAKMAGPKGCALRGGRQRRRCALRGRGQRWRPRRDQSQGAARRRQALAADSETVAGKALKEGSTAAFLRFS